MRDDRTFEIIGAAIEVHRTLGAGFLELVYQEAMAVELTLRGIPFKRDVPFPIIYKGQSLGTPYRADFLAYGEIIIETKAVSNTNEHHVAQVVNYLKAASLATGLLLNFGQSTLEKRRVVFTSLSSSAPSPPSA